MTAVQVTFVFEQGDELSPRNILLVTGITVTLKHTLNVQVFNEHGVVLLDEPRCEFVLVVHHFASNPTLDLGDLQASFLVVVRVSFFPRQLPLLTAESFVLVFKVEPVYGLAVTCVDM